MVGLSVTAELLSPVTMSSLPMFEWLHFPSLLGPECPPPSGAEKVFDRCLTIVTPSPLPPLRSPLCPSLFLCWSLHYKPKCPFQPFPCQRTNESMKEEMKDFERRPLLLYSGLPYILRKLVAILPPQI